MVEGGKSYFACRKGYGVFVEAKPDQITLVSDGDGDENLNGNRNGDQAFFGNASDCASVDSAAPGIRPSSSGSAGTAAVRVCYSPLCRADASFPCYSATAQCTQGGSGGSGDVENDLNAFTDVSKTQNTTRCMLCALPLCVPFCPPFFPRICFVLRVY